MTEFSYNRFAMRWGGAAGDGLQSTGNLLQKYFNSLGYYVQGFPGTQSTIRGGHVWQHVEISTNKMESFDRPIHMLIALDNQTLQVHLRDVKSGGILLYNSDKTDISDVQEEIGNRKLRPIPVPLTTLAREVDLQTPVLANTVAVGVILYILGIKRDAYRKTLAKRFSGNDHIKNLNFEALDCGFSFAESHYSPMVQLKPSQSPLDGFLVISGNEMIALGAVASGLKFLAQYPITPASSILTYLSRRSKRYGVVVRQAEDELAAINMVIGASYAGARAMTASSGPGLSLMAESFGYASMTETPIVVVNSMRAGPSTGIPTKMEQSDLSTMLHLSHGEGPRAILAPRNMQEAFDITVRAFNLADRYQIPVIILSDFALSERTENIPPFDLDVDIDRGKIWKEPSKEFPQFKRYQFTEDGISPRAFPPTEGGNYILVGAEHDQESHSLSGNRCGLPSSWSIKEKMVEKRFKKLDYLRSEMQSPHVYGKDQSDLTIICWGSTEGAVKEAVDHLNSRGLRCNMISFSDLHPLPLEPTRTLLEKTQTTVMFEVNHTGQFENILYQNLEWKADHRIHPMTGETPTPSSVLREIDHIITKMEVAP